MAEPVTRAIARAIAAHLDTAQTCPWCSETAYGCFSTNHGGIGEGKHHSADCLAVALIDHAGFADIWEAMPRGRI